MELPTEKLKISYLEQKVVKIPGLTESISITGRIAIAELVTMGIDEDFFHRLSGLQLPDDKSVSVRDYATNNGISFGEIREEL